MYKPNEMLAEIADLYPEHADDLNAVANHIDSLRGALAIARNRLGEIVELASIANPLKCPACKGVGKIEGDTNCIGNTHWDICPVCSGTGKPSVGDKEQS